MTGGHIMLAVLLLALVLVNVFTLVAPRRVWEINRLFIAWQFDDREVLEPSRAWLVYARGASGLALVVLALLLVWIFLH